MKDIVELLTLRKETISTMESCTGGGLANAITSVPGSSEVFNFGAVTYSNAYKIKLGVDAKIIEEYSVYSMETAKEMSRNITAFTSSNYGVGITGKLKRNDVNNPYGKDNIVYISIYDRTCEKYYNNEIVVTEEKREDNKNIVINKVVEMLLEILK